MSNSPQHTRKTYNESTSVHAKNQQNIYDINDNYKVFDDAEDGDTTIRRGSRSTRFSENPRNRCNDFIFSLLFMLHLGAIVAVTIRYVPIMFNDMSNYVMETNMFNDDAPNDDAKDDDFVDDGAINGDDWNGDDWDDAVGDDLNRALQVAVFKTVGFMPKLLVDKGTTYFLKFTINIFSFMSITKGEEESRSLQEADYSNYVDDIDIDIHEVLLLVCASSLMAFSIAAILLPLLIYCSHTLIKFGVIFNVIMAQLAALLGAMFQLTVVAIVGVLLFILSLWYACVVWNRIPFAASNLSTAVTAVQANSGLVLYAYISTLVLFGWSVWWSLASVGTLYVLGDCHGLDCEYDINGWVLFLFLLSFFWTHQVIKNIVHVTVAGTVGAWWFTPLDAAACCSTAICNSFLRSTIFSFGSICLGSLFVSIVQATKEIVRCMRDEGGDMLLCCGQCFLRCIDVLIEAFNQWAFVFVGVYGFSFMESGSKVMELFKSRGWTTIINDNLIDGVLFMMSLGVGLITGILAVVLAQYEDFQSLTEISSFFVGLVVGFAITSVSMGVIGSAVNTVIVCYAEDPAIFECNHTELSHLMRLSWREAWPTYFKY